MLCRRPASHYIDHGLGGGTRQQSRPIEVIPNIDPMIRTRALGMSLPRYLLAEGNLEPVSGRTRIVPNHFRKSPTIKKTASLTGLLTP